jgi:hypothetical protein
MEWEAVVQENLRPTRGFTVATACGSFRNKNVVMSGEPMQRFEELCDLIAIERDVEEFSTLVTELNQLDPTQSSHHRDRFCKIDILLRPPDQLIEWPARGNNGKFGWSGPVVKEGTRSIDQGTSGYYRCTRGIWQIIRKTDRN